MSCQATTDASCLSFCLAAALLLQLHNAAMLPQSHLAGIQNCFATLRHSSLDMTRAGRKYNSCTSVYKLYLFSIMIDNHGPVKLSYIWPNQINTLFRVVPFRFIFNALSTIIKFALTALCRPAGSDNRQKQQRNEIG